MLLSEAFEMYRRDYIVFKNQSARTEESNDLARRSLVGFVGDIPLETLSFQNIRDWKENLECCVSKNTVRLYIIRLRVVLRFMRIRGYPCVSEESVGVPKRQSKIVKFVTPEQVEMMVAAVNASPLGYSKLNKLRAIAVIRTLAASGVRVTELCSMNRDDAAHISGFTVIGKGDKPRPCFLDNLARDAVQRYLTARPDNNQALFLKSANGKRIDKGGVEAITRTAGRLAEIPFSVTPHTFRHGFATDLLRNNTNLVYVRDFLGHSSVQTTEMYTHVVNEDLRRIYLEKHTCKAQGY